ncbi:MAG: hypothetical protein J5606_01935 [Bacteroidales bacterium]|nr:hypothetical protein [Bacteroidales bacterium]
MSTNINGNLTYRDFVVHIFTGILFNLFLIVALWSTLFPYCEEYARYDKVALSLVVAIPILFLEGHFILAIDRFFFIEIPKCYFMFRVCWFHRYLRKLRQKPKQKTTYIHYRKVAYRLRIIFRKKLWHKHKILFFIFLLPRISGQKVLREAKDGALVETSNLKNEADYNRCYVLSDFFKGVCCATMITLVVAVCAYNWVAVGILLLIFILSRMRERFYSMLYVKYRYVRQKEEKLDIGK